MRKIIKLSIFFFFFLFFLAFLRTEVSALPICDAYGSISKSFTDYNCRLSQPTNQMCDEQNRNATVSCQTYTAGSGIFGSGGECGDCYPKNKTSCTGHSQFVCDIPAAGGGCKSGHYDKWCTYTWGGGSDPLNLCPSHQRWASCGPAAECARNSDCAGAKVCNDNGQCVCPTPSCSGKCGTVTNSCGKSVNCGGCGNNNTCQNNTCVARYSCSGTSCVKTVGGSYGGSNCGGNCVECAANNDCGNNETCAGGRCVTRYACSGTQCVATRGGSYTGSNCGGNCVECTSNSNCGNNETCVSGSCVTRYACSGNACVPTRGGSYTGSNCGGNCVPNAPNSPSGLASSSSCTSSNSTNLNFEWNPVNTAASYDLRYKRSGTTGWTRVDGIGTGTGGDGKVHRTVGGLGVNRNYDWQVRAVNAGGGSSWVSGPTAGTVANCTTATPTPAPTPTPPPSAYNVTVGVFYDNTNLTWDGNESCFRGGGNNIFNVYNTGSAASTGTKYTFKAGNTASDCTRTVSTSSLNHTVRLIVGNISYKVRGYTFRDENTTGGNGRTYTYTSASNRRDDGPNGQNYSVVNFNGFDVAPLDVSLRGSTVRFALANNVCTPLTQAEACDGQCGGITVDNGCGTGTYTCSGTTYCSVGQVCSSNICTDTYSITGNIYVDSDKNGNKDVSEVNYATRTGITNKQGAANAGTLSWLADGNYRVTGLNAGTYTVSYSLDTGWSITAPSGAVGTPSYTVTVGPSCLDPDGAGGDASCDGTNNIVNLNFGISDAKPWIQTDGGIIESSSFVNPVPKPADAPICGAVTIKDANPNNPAILRSGGTINTGQGAVSSRGWKVENTKYTPAVPGVIRTSYNYITSVLKQQGIAENKLNAAGQCGGGGYSNCTITAASLPSSGIYKPDDGSGGGDLTISSATFAANRNYIILVNGDLTITGNIIVPSTSSVVFSVSGDILVDKNVGASSVTDQSTFQLQGIFSADQNFIIQGTGNCAITPDKRLNIEGAVITGANGGGGSLVWSGRDTCDKQCPVFYVKQRLGMILRLPNILRAPTRVYKEVAP